MAMGRRASPTPSPGHLAIQCEDDEYGTIGQVLRLVREVVDAEVLALKHSRYSPHRSEPEAVIEALTRFVHRVIG
jgi:hypothetical protein